MFRRWWKSLSFYWQIYLFMVIAFGGIITFVEAVAEPFFLAIIVERSQVSEEVGEIILWIGSVFIPTLILGFVVTHLVMRKMGTMVTTAKRLSTGDLSARIPLSGNSGDVFFQLSEVFNEMAQSLHRLVDQEKRLLADISHELRSPLTRMGIATELLALKKELQEIEKVAAILDTEISQMNFLVGQLLEHARDRLVHQGDFSAVNLSDMAADVVDSHSLSASTKNIEINTSITPGIYIWGHPMRLRTIFDNILTNAEFYTPSGTSVSIHLARYADHVSITIRDSGPGVPDDKLEDIFRAFYRIDESRARTSGGVGLGLALAHDAALAMGGDIIARNCQPGLEITVTLPPFSSVDQPRSPP